MRVSSATETAMDYAARERLVAELDSIREQGLYKTERVIATPHLVSSTFEAQALTGVDVAGGVRAALAGDRGRISG